MTDYSKTIIYKIQHEDNQELVYVGSTTDFTKRKWNHKTRSNNPNDNKHHLKLYKMINDNGGWEAFRMVQIKEFSCNNKREAEAEEDAVMLELKATMNDRRASRTQKEWVEDNKEQIAQNKKEYYELNKDQILASRREYRQLNKEQLSQYQKEYRELNKEQLSQYQKDYSEFNKAKKLDYNKQYREDNKKQLLQYNKQKITCDCGCIVTKTNLSQHKKTTKHTKLLNELIKQ